MLSAARAVMAGVPDPIAFLSHEGIEWDIAVIAVEEALTRRSEIRQAELKAVIASLSTQTGNEVGRVIASVFR